MTGTRHNRARLDSRELIETILVPFSPSADINTYISGIHHQQAGIRGEHKCDITDMSVGDRDMPRFEASSRLRSWSRGNAPHRRRDQH